MPPALLGSATQSGVNGGTTGALNSTGATLLLLSSCYYAVSSLNPSISDSQGNTWTALTLRRITGSFGARIYYSLNPTTSATHTATFADTAIYSGTIFTAWSGVASYAQESGADSSAGVVTSLQPGSLTPPEDDCLIYSCLGQNGAISGMSVNSGLTPIASVVYGAGNNFGQYDAYLVQATAAAINPTWSWTTAQFACAAMAVFRPQVAGYGRLAPYSGLVRSGLRYSGVVAA